MKKYQFHGMLTLGSILFVSMVALDGPQLPGALAAGPAESSPSASPAQCGGDSALRAFFKGAPGGMRLKDKLELHDEKGLFDYIDGGAPLYIDRHFRKLAAAEMVGDDGIEFVCDIYDMSAPENATAIFNKEHSSAMKPVANWPEAMSSPMSFIFHSKCYYVKLTAFSKKTDAALPAFAKALRDRMK